MEKIEDFVDGETSDEGTKQTGLPNQGTVQGNVEGAPAVDAGKQGKHVIGHNNDNNPKKTKWPKGEDGVDLTQEGRMDEWRDVTRRHKSVGY